MFSQYAQDQDYLNEIEFSKMNRSEAECSTKPKLETKDKNLKQRRREKPKKRNSTKSFVMNRHHRQGLKLIKIQVIDLCNNNNTIQSSDSDNDSENILINAQYIVTDVVDSVMDETESLVKKISKSLIVNDYL